MRGKIIILKEKKLSLKLPAIDDNPRQHQKKRQRKFKDEKSTPEINTFFKKKDETKKVSKHRNSCQGLGDKTSFVQRSNSEEQ